VAVEDIGGLYNTKQPGYDDAADIQAALKAFLYGSYDYDTTSTDPTQLPNPSLAKHLQGLKDRIEDQEELGIGSDYLTLAQIGALTGVADGYIAMASDSNGGAVESLYASAFYTNEAPTTDIVDGVLWVDKDSTALDTYVYDSTLLPGDPWVRINDLKNIVAAKGDLLVGTASEGLDNLTVGANGTVLTADNTQPLGIKWEAPSVYSQPTLGTTAIASGATVTNVNDLTINSTTIPTSKTLVATDSTAYVVPPMSGNAGKYLTNDGSTPSWATISTTPAFVGCSVYGVRSQLMANGSTTYALPFTAQYFDTHNFHSTVTNNTRITIPSGKSGKYQINVQVAYDNASGTPGYLNWFVRIDGSGSYSITTAQLQATTPAGITGSTNNSIVSNSGIISFNEGQYFEILSRTDNGNGNIYATPYVTVTYLGA
jgi:hypothetical protein